MVGGSSDRGLVGSQEQSSNGPRSWVIEMLGTIGVNAVLSLTASAVGGAQPTLIFDRFEGEVPGDYS